MAEIITGSDDTFRLLSFGLPNQGVIGYINEQYDRLRTVLPQAASNFIESSFQSFQRYCSDDALRLAKSVLRKKDNLFLEDVVMPLRTLEEFQQASIYMQRWIMASPVVRDLYQKNQIEGYSDSYFDTEPGAIGVNHTDYQKVVNGICFDLPEDDPRQSDWCAEIFFHEDDEGTLSIEDQVTILSVWDMIQNKFKRGNEDPTSPYRNKM